MRGAHTLVLVTRSRSPVEGSARVLALARNTWLHGVTSHWSALDGLKSAAPPHAPSWKAEQASDKQSA